MQMVDLDNLSLHHGSGLQQTGSNALAGVQVLLHVCRHRLVPRGVARLRCPSRQKTVMNAQQRCWNAECLSAGTGSFTLPAHLE